MAQLTSAEKTKNNAFVAYMGIVFEKAGISNSAFAHKMGAGQSTVRHWQHGYIVPGRSGRDLSIDQMTKLIHFANELDIYNIRVEAMLNNQEIPANKYAYTTSPPTAPERPTEPVVTVPAIPTEDGRRPNVVTLARIPVETAGDMKLNDVIADLQAISSEYGNLPVKLGLLEKHRISGIYAAIKVVLTINEQSVWR